jgi:SAM-dependent MidA family methyltransferase
LDESRNLETEIHRLIALAGPMPVAQYMDLCLYHPRLGYYTTHDPLGRGGDFTTAPEISQMFGELVGLWAAAVWRQMGAPENVRLIELGPGRGTLMADALRALQVVPAFRAAIVLHLVEISPALRQRQREMLQDPAVPVRWHTTLQEVPAGPAIIIANEFFDALPVHQAVKQADGWHERVVAVNAAGNFEFALAADRIPHIEPLLPTQVREAPVGAIYEWRNDATALELGRRAVQGPGAALVIDYGHTASAPGDTFQAVRQHAYADPLTELGLVDLTAHVDFQALAQAAESIGAAVHGPIEQGELLRRLGIDARAAALKAKATRPISAEIDVALARLTGGGRKGMGALFKALALTHPRLGPPPGFEV